MKKKCMFAHIYAHPMIVFSCWASVATQGERELTHDLLALVFGFTMSGSAAVVYGRYF